MSLDERIRRIAEEAAARSGGGGDSGAAVRCVELEKQIADHQAQLRDLHDHLHRALTQVEHLARRVTALEAAGAAPHPSEPESAPVSRRAGGRRKSTES